MSHNEGTHFVCQEVLDRDGGRAVGCCCTGHECKEQTVPEEQTMCSCWPNLEGKPAYAHMDDCQYAKKSSPKEFANQIHSCNAHPNCVKITDSSAQGDSWQERFEEEYGSFRLCDRISKPEYDRLKAFIEQEIKLARESERERIVKETQKMIDTNYKQTQEDYKNPFWNLRQDGYRQALTDLLTNLRDKDEPRNM